jgi:hypothetical protein
MCDVLAILPLDEGDKSYVCSLISLPIVRMTVVGIFFIIGYLQQPPSHRII